MVFCLYQVRLYWRKNVFERKVGVSGQEEVEKRKNQQKLIELMNRVKNCLQEGKFEKIRVTIENKEE